MCKISALPQDVEFNGLIVRDDLGHTIILNFDRDRKKGLKLLKKNLRAIEAQIIEEFTGHKNEMRSRILELNKKAGLPGINSQIVA